MEMGDELDVLDGTSPIYGPTITVFIVTVKILLIEHARVSRARFSICNSCLESSGLSKCKLFCGHIFVALVNNDESFNFNIISFFFFDIS